MTNYERIKNMSVEEMAEKLHIIDDGGTLVCRKYNCRTIPDTGVCDCVLCYKDWLNEEVEQ